MRIYVPERLEVKFLNIIRKDIQENGGSMSGTNDNIYFINKKQHKLVKDVCYELR